MTLKTVLNVWPIFLRWIHVIPPASWLFLSIFVCHNVFATFDDKCMIQWASVNICCFLTFVLGMGRGIVSLSVASEGGLFSSMMNKHSAIMRWLNISVTPGVEFSSQTVSVVTFLLVSSHEKGIVLESKDTTRGRSSWILYYIDIQWCNHHCAPIETWVYSHKNL